MPADSLQKQSRSHAGRLFQKGRSSNPAGRRPGCRNRASLAAEVLLEGEALTRKAIELALEGDTAALRLCLERIVPRCKLRAVAFDLPRSALDGATPLEAYRAGRPRGYDGQDLRLAHIPTGPTATKKSVQYE